MRIAVRPVECVLVGIRKFKHIIRRSAVISGLMRPIPALAVLEARICIAVKRTRHEFLKISGLQTRQRVYALNHRAGILVLAEPVHVIFRNDTERTHLLLAGIVRIIIGDKHIRQRRKWLPSFSFGIDLVKVAAKRVSHTPHKESMLFVGIVAVLLWIVLAVDCRIGRECLSR